MSLESVDDPAPAGVPPDFMSDLERHAQARLPAMELAAVMGIGRFFIVPYAILLLVFGYLLAGWVPGRQWMAWMLIYACYIAARTWATRAYHRDPQRHAPGRLAFWRGAVTLSAAGHGLILGALAWLALPRLPEMWQFALLGMVLAVCASGLIWVAAMLRALLLLVSCALVPYVFSWLFLVDSALPLTPVLAGMLAVMVYLGTRHHRIVRDNFALLAKSEVLLDELGRKNRQLEAVHRSRTRLLATASHDLRQPVHTLGLLIARLNAWQPPAQLNAAFARLEHACFIVSEMLAELMDLSQLESRDYRTRITPIALDAMLEQVKLNYAHLAQGKGLDFQVRFSGLRVASDARLLRRVLFNLTANAIRYTAQGQVAVQARVEGAEVVLTVSDTGRGIAAHDQPRIFDDHVRVDGDATGTEGMGLGLAIVRRACAVLGHTVSLASRPGVGSEFRLRLPLCPDGGVEAGAPPQPGTRAALRHTLLVAENDRESLEALCALLASWGYQCIALGSSEALAATLDAAVTPSAIVTDLHLGPDMDGLALIARARAQVGQPRLPALLVTGHVDSPLALRAHAAGVALAYKPLAPQHLRRELELLLAGGPPPAPPAAGLP